MAPIMWLGIVAILTYTGWNLKDDWDNFWYGDGDDGGGGGGIIPTIPLEPGGGWVLLLVAAAVAFAFARSR